MPFQIGSRHGQGCHPGVCEWHWSTSIPGKGADGIGFGWVLVGQNSRTCKWTGVHLHISRASDPFQSTCMVVNSDLLVPIHTQSHQLPFQECWSIHIIHKLPDTTPDHIRHQFETAYLLVLQTRQSLVLTFITSLGLPCHPTLPFPPLATPAKVMVSLIPTADESNSVGWMLLFSPWFFYTTRMSTDMS